MKIEKVLETVFIEDYNTTAIILETRIVVQLFQHKYMCRQQCFEYIEKYMPGWVQTSELFREAKRKKQKTGIESDPLLAYEHMYDDLIMYATEKFKNEFKNNI